MLLLLCWGASVGAIGSDVTMGNASGPGTNAMEAVLTALMVATRLLRDVPETAPRDTSNATVANVSWAVENATTTC